MATVSKYYIGSIISYPYDELIHHGVKGQRWGIKNGPPYPLDAKGKLKAVKNLSKSLDSEWEYGVLHNGEHLTDTGQYNWGRDYRTTPIDTLEKEKIGTCWDFVNYQHHILKSLGIKDESYLVFIQRSDDPTDAVTHTFTTFDLNGKKYWLESAAYPKRGLHEIKSWKDPVSQLVDMYKSSEYGYSLFRYNPDGMDKGLTGDQFIERATSDENYVYDEPGVYTKKK